MLAHRRRREVNAPRAEEVDHEEKAREEVVDLDRQEDLDHQVVIPP